MGSLPTTSSALISRLVFRDLLASSPEVECERVEDPRNVVVRSSIVSQNLSQGTDQGAWVQVRQEAWLQS